MFYINRSRNLLFQNLNLIRYITYPAKENVDMPNRIQFLTNVLEFSNQDETLQLLKKNKHMFSLTDEDVSNSVKFLVSIGITGKELRNDLSLLNYKEITLRNRYEVLLECGCPSVTAYHLNRYLKILNRSEKLLKDGRIIPKDINLHERLAEILQVKLDTCNEDIPLKFVRLHILKLFYVQKDIMNVEEFNKLINHYAIGKSKSYHSIKEILNLLLHQLNMSKNKIKNNFFALSADPDNLLKLLAMKPIAGYQMRDVIKTYPKIMMTSSGTIEQILDHIYNFGLTEKSVTKCFRVLTLSSETVYERLVELNKIKELEVMKDHPRVLNLVFHQSLTNARISYLKLLNVKCFSLNVLTAPLDKFQRYSQQADDENRSKDSLTFLVKTFDRNALEIKDKICRHSYWLQISISDMKQTITELTKVGFSLEDIYSNIHIILYSSLMVLNRLQILKETVQIQGINTSDLSNLLKLKLALYMIELEYHFTGDGVWVERVVLDRHILSFKKAPMKSSNLKTRKILERKA